MVLKIIPQPGVRSIGLQFTAPPKQSAQTLPFEKLDATAVVQDLVKRLASVEQIAQLSVGKDRIMSTIAMSKEAILIQASQIGIAGSVSFYDYLRDINGASTGVLDPAITQIRGGVIRTGKVVSMDAMSWLNLDATGSQNFIQCRSSVAIGANGSFTFGSASGKQLSWDGTSLSIGGSTVNLQTGTSLNQIESNATYGATRSVGDITADVLTYSGTITNTVTATLFKFTNTVGGHAYEFGIGAGGFYGKKDGVDMFSATTATGEGRFSGRFTSGSVFADGSVSSGLGAGQAAGVFLGSGSVRGLIATNGAYITGTVYADNFVTTSGALPNAGHANTADSLSSPLPLTGLAVGSTANFSVSSDGGATWTPFKFRRDA